MKPAFFYMIAKGERFRFPDDTSNALCVKLGPNTYRVEEAAHSCSVGLKCMLPANAKVLRLPENAPCRWCGGEVKGKAWEARCVSPWTGCLGKVQTPLIIS